jgi:hypothetical protein
MPKLISVSGGEVRAVYEDKWRVLLEALGPLEVTRASDVEYDSVTGEWFAIYRASGLEIARGKDRAAVIAQEVDWLERSVIMQSR